LRIIETTQEEARLSEGSRFKDFVQFAIDNEVEAARLYEKYALVAKQASSKKLLKDMAAMERGHEARLKEFLKSGSAYFSKIGVIADLHVSDFMVASELSESSTIEEVFVFAMKAEQKANELYAKLGSLETDANVKKVFLALADEEKKHKYDLEKEYEKEFASDN
jgi:rubrerythrin